MKTYVGDILSMTKEQWESKRMCEICYQLIWDHLKINLQLVYLFSVKQSKNA